MSSLSPLSALILITSERTTVIFTDDQILGYIHQSAGKVTCIRSFQGAVSARPFRAPWG